MSHILRKPGDLPKDKFMAQLKRDADKRPKTYAGRDMRSVSAAEKRAEAAELRAATAEVWEL